MDMDVSLRSVKLLLIVDGRTCRIFNLLPLDIEEWRMKKV